MTRTLSVVCFVGAVALATVGGYRALDPALPAALTEPNAVCDLGTVSPGEQEFVIRFQNTGGQPGRVIGFEASCARNCCFKPKDEVQLLVPPGQTVECRGLLSVSEAGPFEGPVHLFYHDTDIRKAVVMVKGVCVVPRAGDAPK